MTRTQVYLEIAEELQFGKYILQQVIGKSAEGLGRVYLWARNAKRGKSSQNQSSKFVGLRMVRDSWQMLIGQEDWLEAVWSKMA